MRPFGSAVESAVQRSGDRVGSNVFVLGWKRLLRADILGGGVAFPFLIPVDGVWRLTYRGAGGSGSAATYATSDPSYQLGGASGALGQKTTELLAGSELMLLLGEKGASVFAASNGISVGVSGGATSITLPNGALLRAGGGVGGRVGAGNVEATATGGDVNINGSLPGAPGKGSAPGQPGASGGVHGAGAPGLVDFPGGQGTSQAAGSSGVPLSATALDGAGSGSSFETGSSFGARSGAGGGGSILLELVG